MDQDTKLYKVTFGHLDKRDYTPTVVPLVY